MVLCISSWEKRRLSLFLPASLSEMDVIINFPKLFIEINLFPATIEFGYAWALRL